MMHTKKSQLASRTLAGFLTLSSLLLLEGLIIPYSNRAEDVKFLLYSKGQDGAVQITALQLGDIDQLKASPFCPELPTVVLIHGYWCDANSNFPSKVRDAYLETASSTRNLIVVDWGRLSHPGTVPFLANVIFPLTYLPIVLENLPTVSARVADFIGFLVETKSVTLPSLHVVGHSLGAHISGWVGQLTQEKSGGNKIGRISGLDPAGPGFDLGGVTIQRRLKKEDATFTDVYHTAMGTRGDISVDGDVDFYPNGGVVQPPCPEDGNPLTADPLNRGSCSHEWASDLWAAMIRRDIKACQCSPGLGREKLGKCLEICPNPVVAGERCPKEARGLYYFVTKGV